MQGKGADMPGVGQISGENQDDAPSDLVGATAAGDRDCWKA